MNIDLLNNDEIVALRNLINSSQNIAIFCHVNADGDALGSTLAWAEFLNSLGKNARIIVPDMFPDFLRWLPGMDRIVRFDKHKDEARLLIDNADLLCCMDLNTLSRMGEELSSIVREKIESQRVSSESCNSADNTAEMGENANGVLLIDHHLSPDIPCRLQVSFPEMSSTAELVFCLLMQLGAYEGMTKDMAVNIYCGMMTDTGGFTYNSTRPEIFYIISLLLAKGIDKDKIYRNIYHVFSVDRLRLTGHVLCQKMRVLTPLRASYYTISREEQKRFHFIKGDAEGLVNMPLQIKGHRLSISLREDTEKPNLVWVSLRSVDDFPCNKMAAEFFNGGGHKNASGGKLFCSLQEAELVTRKAIQAYSKML